MNVQVSQKQETHLLLPESWFLGLPWLCPKVEREIVRGCAASSARTGSKSGIVTELGVSSRFAELHRSHRPQAAGAS